MKKFAVLLFAVVGLAAFAGTCVIRAERVTDVDGDTFYGAEMLNDSGANILNHRFIVAFLDDDGNVLDTKTVDGCLRSLQNGAVNYFSAQSNEDPDDVEVGLSRLSGPLTFGEVSEGDLELSDIEVTRNGDQLTVTGTLTNNGNDEVFEAQVCVIVRDDSSGSGRVQRVQLDNNEYDVAEDEDIDFSITTTVNEDEDLTDRIDVVADALDEDDNPVEPVIEDDIDVEECPDAATSTPTSTGTTTPTNTAVPTSTGTITAVPTSTPDPCD
jgi:hypothetical protein